MLACDSEANGMTLTLKASTIFRSLCLLLTLVTFTACSVSSGNKTISDDSVLSRIQQGRSKKEDVRALLGDPEGVEFPSAAAEKWTYTYFDSHIGFHNFIPFVGLLTSGTDKNKTYVLEINFVRSGTVKDYSWTRSQGVPRKLLD